MTSCVSDSAVSRLVRLCVETADGSGDVSVIREAYAILIFGCGMKKVWVLCWKSCELGNICVLTFRSPELGSRHQR